jgi:hypothetical protein
MSMHRWGAECTKLGKAQILRRREVCDEKKRRTGSAWRGSPPFLGGRKRTIKNVIKNKIRAEATGSDPARAHQARPAPAGAPKRCRSTLR